MDKLAKLFKKKQILSINTEIDQKKILDFLDLSLKIIQPGIHSKKHKSFISFKSDVKKINVSLEKILIQSGKTKSNSKIISKKFINNILELNLLLEDDINAIFTGDPAARCIDEVIYCYPGVFAIATYRIAHLLYEMGVDVLPRMLTEIAHSKTGIDIHPGAKIGNSFFIDHGTGIVIGETAIIGDRVKIYQGVTLGALSVSIDMKNKKRHPTVGDDCVIYAHATILGGETSIGPNSIIGGNVWLTKSVPEKSIVYHRSEIKLSNVENHKTIEELLYEI